VDTPVALADMAPHRWFRPPAAGVEDRGELRGIPEGLLLLPGELLSKRVSDSDMTMEMKKTTT
jgi:hypothetical protein